MCQSGQAKFVPYKYWYCTGEITLDQVGTDARLSSMLREITLHFDNLPQLGNQRQAILVADRSRAAGCLLT